ncbi:MAG TPA: lipase maturation factor family protein [Candidatus Acidoferrum sp.]|jgi:hypothetical protein
MAWISARVCWLFDTEHGATDRLIPRWLFLRALGFIYFSAFFSLVFQIHGLIGPQGILPAGEYLQAVAHAFGHAKGVWFAPSLLWFSSGPHMLSAVCWIGMGASLLLVVNWWPRGMLAVCFVCFLSFVTAAQDFSGYQSDGMLLEAGFLSLLFSPAGFRPGLGLQSPSSRASLFLLQWEWFRIYFESGVAKIMSGDEQWRHFAAMDEYYQNGPLPTWIGWHVQHLPHWFHASSTGATLVLEWALVWMLFLPRRWRIVGFFIVTPWELGVILTANYAFLNYLVLILGFLLLDDRFLLRFMTDSWKKGVDKLHLPSQDQHENAPVWSQKLKLSKMVASAVLFSWLFYATVAQLTWMVFSLPLPTSPVAALDPFRIANRYGLFGVMTRGRYEIEFQGSQDGKNWIAYPFRFKPQDLDKPPGIYAPYQPRFDWNLWFASLGSWRDYSIVPRTEEKLLSNDADVLHLFKANPFPEKPPKQVRAVLWQYWFTSLQEKRTKGLWWRRKFLGLYAPAVERKADGTIRATEWPTAGPREE